MSPCFTRVASSSSQQAAHFFARGFNAVALNLAGHHEAPAHRVVAHAAGVKVTAHAHGAESIKDAILAGVDSVEHASLGDDEAVELAAEHGVAFSMDVYNGTFTAEVGEELGYPEEFMRKNDETTEAQRIVFEKAYAAGVPILYGTDAGVLQHGMNGRQFGIMVRRGMAPMDAIKSATSLAAEHMDMAPDVGAIEVGRFGDLVAVRGNPLDDITLLEDIPIVIKGGTIVKNVPPKAAFNDRLCLLKLCTPVLLIPCRGHNAFQNF